MQAWLERVGRLMPFGKTASAGTKMAGTPLVALEGLSAPSWTTRDFAAYAREGMMRNPVVYRCVRMISEAAASVPIEVKDRSANVIAGHPVADLMASPSSRGRSGAAFLEACFGTLLVSGNLYLEAAGVGGEIGELHHLRPDRVRVLADADGWPQGFEYAVGHDRRVIAGEVVPGVERVLHLRLFHPIDDHYGLSPIEAAATAVDIHNAASRWNKALLDNAARPSGALVYTTGGHMTADQFGRLKNELEENFQGARNAGRPLLLEGGLDWKAMSLSPRDMDFIEAKHAAARDIALALGVPPMLLGIPGDNTYANLQEANRMFWRQAVLPLVYRTTTALARWLSPAWPDEPFMLVPDIEGIEALRSEREALWRRLDAASFLTGDEKRQAVGYPPLTGDDQSRPA